MARGPIMEDAGVGGGDIQQPRSNFNRPSRSQRPQSRGGGGGRVPTSTTQTVSKIYKLFDFDNDVVANQKQVLTSGLWSTGTGTLTTFFTSSTQSGSSGACERGAADGGVGRVAAGVSVYGTLRAGAYDENQPE